MRSINAKIRLLVIVILILTIIGCAVTLLIRLSSQQPREILITDNKPAQQGWKVCVEGAVASPGIYTLKDEDRVVDIISLCGLKGDADTGALRLYIPLTSESVRPQRVSLNHADAWLIAALPGVGTEKARAIVDYRKQNGPYNRVDDLLKVKGIGKAIVDNIRELVTLTD